MTAGFLFAWVREAGGWRAWANKFRSVSRVGLDGYDSVVLQKSQIWRRGDERFQAKFEGCVYSFLDANNRDEFNANPKKFAPVLSGNDVVLAMDGKLVAGSRRHGLWLGDRIYLFVDEDNLNQFASSPHRYDALVMSH